LGELAGELAVNWLNCVGELSRKFELVGLSAATTRDQRRELYEST
jgi:hypothetical protein